MPYLLSCCPPSSAMPPSPKKRLFFGSHIPLQHHLPPPSLCRLFREPGNKPVPLLKPLTFFTLVPWNRGGWGGGGRKGPQGLGR